MPLDYKTYNDIKESIRILQAEGRTILMTSHHYDDLEMLFNHIYSIDEGELSVLSSEEMKKRFRGWAEMAPYITAGSRNKAGIPFRTKVHVFKERHHLDKTN